MIVARKPVLTFRRSCAMVSKPLTNASPRGLYRGTVHRKESPRGRYSSAQCHHASDRVRGAGTPLPAGQVVQALVLELIQSDVFRLQLPQAVVDVRSDVPLAPGSTVTLAVKGTGANARLVVYADDAQRPCRRRRPQCVGQHQASRASSRSARQSSSRRARRCSRAGRPVNAPACAMRRRSLPRAHRSRSRNSRSSITPERALGEAVRRGGDRQSGLAPLFADIEQVAGAARSTLPAPVRAAARQIAALRVPLDENLPLPIVKQAFVRSGVLFEPRVAAGKVAEISIATRLRRKTPAPAATSRPRCWCSVRCSRSMGRRDGAVNGLPRLRSCRPHPSGSTHHARQRRRGCGGDQATRQCARGRG